MDETEGFDQENNSFASMSEEFLSNKQVGLIIRENLKIIN